MYSSSVLLTEQFLISN